MKNILYTLLVLLITSAALGQRVRDFPYYISLTGDS